MFQYPMSFHVSAVAQFGIQSGWRANPADSVDSHFLNTAIPPEFDGPGSGYSPEDYYSLALANCFIATFKVIAEKSNLYFSNITAKGLLSVDRNEKGAPWMKAFHLTIDLDGVVDRERALRLLEKTSQSCMILNSVKTEKTFEFNVRGNSV